MARWPSRHRGAAADRGLGQRAGPGHPLRDRLAVALTSVGLVAIIVAAATGVAFVRNGGNGASLSMALAAAVALFCYLAAIFALGGGSEGGRAGG